MSNIARSYIKSGLVSNPVGRKLLNFYRLGKLGKLKLEEKKLFSVLGLKTDVDYYRERSRIREECLESLKGCAPVGATPEEMANYLQESCLRAWETTEWVRAVLGSSSRTEKPRLLEIGSNPYFISLKLAEAFPKMDIMGVNFFGDESQIGKFLTQGVTDPRGRMKEARFFSADVERHDLSPTGEFDICLFCEVLEHLPYDPAWALTNIAQRLKPGGTMILTTPNPGRLENVLRLAFHTGSTADPISGYGIHGRHNREYTMDELKELMTGVGFEIQKTTSLDVFPSPYSRDSERKGYGQYQMIMGTLRDKARVYRPEWLYRSFEPGRLASQVSLRS